jgi:hypothetical protein
MQLYLSSTPGDPIGRKTRSSHQSYHSSSSGYKNLPEGSTMGFQQAFSRPWACVPLPLQDAMRVRQASRSYIWGLSEKALDVLLLMYTIEMDPGTRKAQTVGCGMSCE